MFLWGCVRFHEDPQLSRKTFHEVPQKVQRVSEGSIGFNRDPEGSTRFLKERQTSPKVLQSSAKV